MRTSCSHLLHLISPSWAIVHMDPPAIRDTTPDTKRRLCFCHRHRGAERQEHFASCRHVYLSFSPLVLRTRPQPVLSSFETRSRGRQLPARKAFLLSRPSSQRRHRSLVREAGRVEVRIRVVIVTEWLPSVLAFAVLLKTCPEKARPKHCEA